MAGIRRMLVNPPNLGIRDGGLCVIISSSLYHHFTPHMSPCICPGIRPVYHEGDKPLFRHRGRHRQPDAPHGKQCAHGLRVHRGRIQLHRGCRPQR